MPDSTYSDNSGKAGPGDTVPSVGGPVGAADSHTAGTRDSVSHQVTDDPAAVFSEVAGPVAVITINRPQARNAINERVSAGLAAAVDELDERRDVQVIVITGAGGTFSAGMDLKAFLAGDNPLAGGRGFGGIVERPPSKPVIAAVEGYALAAASRWLSPAISSWPARRRRSGCRR